MELTEQIHGIFGVFDEDEGSSHNHVLPELRAALEDTSRDLYGFLDDAFACNAESFKVAKNYRTGTWDFVRDAKSHENLKGVRDFDALARVEEWMADRGLRWTGFPDVLSADDGRAQFLNEWETVMFLRNQDVIQAALERTVWTRLRGQHLDRYEWFVSFVASLARMMRGRNFYLPCRKIGAVLGLSYKTISLYRKWATRDGFLVKVNDHVFSKLGKSKATEFQFRFDVFEQESESTE